MLKGDIMRLCIAGVMTIGACFIWGCGAMPGDPTALEVARETCVPIWAPDDPFFDAFVIVIEAQQADGMSKLDSLDAAALQCVIACDGLVLACDEACLLCNIAIIDAVYGN